MVIIIDKLHLFGDSL